MVQQIHPCIIWQVSANMCISPTVVSLSYTSLFMPKKCRSLKINISKEIKQKTEDIIKEALEEIVGLYFLQL